MGATAPPFWRKKIAGYGPGAKSTPPFNIKKLPTGLELLYFRNPSAATMIEEVCGPQGRLCWKINHKNYFSIASVSLWTFQPFENKEMKREHKCPQELGHRQLCVCVWLVHFSHFFNTPWQTTCKFTTVRTIITITIMIFITLMITIINWNRKHIQVTHENQFDSWLVSIYRCACLFQIWKHISKSNSIRSIKKAHKKVIALHVHNFPKQAFW